MKRIYILGFAALVAGIVSCNNATEQNAGSATAVTDSAPAKDNAPAPPATAMPEGAGLIAKSDCNTCHTAESKIVGPSWKDIAAKYPANEANIAKLSDAIIKGGSGVWGAVPMPAHASLAKGDVDKMVSYILTGK